MRLSTVYKKFIFSSLTLILIFGALLQYWIFRQTMHYTADETLEEYQYAIMNHAIKRDTFLTAGLLGVKEGRLRYFPAPDPEEDAFFRDTIIADPRNGKLRNLRILNFPLQVGGRDYRAEVSLRTMGSHDHLLSTLLSFVSVFLLLVLFFFLLIHFFSRKIFLPFSCFMAELRKANVARSGSMTFSETDIDEIRELHVTYHRMMERIHRDFRKTKELSDNITHELQTPLTIMRSKIDLLLQKNGQDEESLQLLQSVQTNINRLARFNRSLMLLTRIGNHPEETCERIDMNGLCRDKMADYAEILEAKGLRGEVIQEGVFIADIHEPLAEVLVNNLLSNAIRYNLSSDGFIRIILREHEMIVENSFYGMLPSGNLFERFVKNKRVGDANGLGLSIVKAICDKFGFLPEWEVDQQVFRFRITSKKR